MSIKKYIVTIYKLCIIATSDIVSFMLACNQQLRNKLFKKTLILNSTVAYIININITIYIIIMQIDSVSDLW